MKHDFVRIRKDFQRQAWNVLGADAPDDTLITGAGETGCFWLFRHGPVKNSWLGIRVRADGDHTGEKFKFTVSEWRALLLENNSSIIPVSSDLPSDWRCENLIPAKPDSKTKMLGNFRETLWEIRKLLGDNCDVLIVPQGAVAIYKEVKYISRFPVNGLTAPIRVPKEFRNRLAAPRRDYDNTCLWIESSRWGAMGKDWIILHPLEAIAPAELARFPQQRFSDRVVLASTGVTAEGILWSLTEYGELQKQ